MRATRVMGRQCRVCGATWDGPSARYCGRCGQPLASDGPSSSGAGHRFPGRRTTLVLLVLGGVVVLAVLAALALVAGRGVTEPEPDAPDPVAAVDLPDRWEIDPSCRPSGCELWRADLGSGHAIAVDEVVIHVGVSDLHAVAIDNGNIAWSAATTGGNAAVTAIPVDGAPMLLVVRSSAGSSEHPVEARDAPTGYVTWTASLPGPVDQASAGADGGGVVVFGDGFVAVLDAATGESRWTARSPSRRTRTSGWR